uniref:Uncharacterized protein n=1 Tax=Anguilla anguilla TaxID=7936 RepID=A0A0E9U123_ANGAN
MISSTWAGTSSSMHNGGSVYLSFSTFFSSGHSLA